MALFSNPSMPSNFAFLLGSNINGGLFSGSLPGMFEKFCELVTFYWNSRCSLLMHKKGLSFLCTRKVYHSWEIIIVLLFLRLPERYILISFLKTIFNCSQTKFVALILVLLSFFSIFCFTKISSDLFDLLSLKTG